MELKFFKNGNKFIMGDRITCIDYVFYHELLTAMILSGNGTATEFFNRDVFSVNANAKMYKLTAWYK